MNAVKKRILAGFTAALLILVISGFIIYQYALDIETPFPGIDISNEDSVAYSSKEAVYFGVISRYPPNIIYNGYQPLMDYLTANTNYRFELRLSNSYKETVQQLVDGDVSAAFLGSYIYLKARKEYGIRCVLKPLNDNSKPFFQSALITKNGNPIYSIKDLKGKKLALPSAQSFSGNWLTLNELNKFGLSFNDLSLVHHFAHHHTVVNQILTGHFDAGIVKERVAKEFINQGVRIFAYSDSFPGSPIVVPKKYNPKVLKAFRGALLKVDVNNPEYQNIVKTWDKEFSNGFVEAIDKDYDQMQAIINKLGAE